MERIMDLEDLMEISFKGLIGLGVICFVVVIGALAIQETFVLLIILGVLGSIFGVGSAIHYVDWRSIWKKIKCIKIEWKDNGNS